MFTLLASIGLLFSILHYTTQQLQSNFDIAVVGCDAVGLTKSCSEFYFVYFGYISLPMMAITGFILILFFVFFADFRKAGR